MQQNLLGWTGPLALTEPTSFNSLSLIIKVTSINEATKTAIEESKLKSELNRPLRSN